MKYFFALFLLLLFFTNLTNSKEIILRFSHESNGRSILMSHGSHTVNNTSIKYRRIDYFLSDFKFIKKNNDTLFAENKYILVRGQTKDFSLGNVDITDINDIINLEYNFGIDKETNHADPSLYPDSHPLSYPYSSMHWGWAAGYRFLAIEGTYSLNNGQINSPFEYHLVSDDYFMTLNYIPVLEEIDNKIIIQFEINMDDILKDVDFTTNSFVHGTGSWNDVIANNIKSSNAFRPKFTSVKNLYPELKLSPIPANDFINLITGSINISTFEFKIFNSNGEFISDYFPNKSSNLNISSFATGVYYLQITNDKTIIKTIKFIKN